MRGPQGTPVQKEMRVTPVITAQVVLAGREAMLVTQALKATTATPVIMG